MKKESNTEFKFNETELNKFYRYAISLTKNEDDAFDLVQNSLEKFLIKKGHEMEFPNSYLYTIIRNKFIDNKRLEQRWVMKSIDDVSNVALLDIESLNDIDNFSENSITSNNQVERIMNYVPTEDREILYLWAVEGHTVKSISDKLEIPRGKLLSRLHKLKKKLRVFLTKEYPDLKHG